MEKVLENGYNKAILFGLSFIWQLGVMITSSFIQLTWTAPLDEIPV